jgi:hypothetical protein
MNLKRERTRSVSWKSSTATCRERSVGEPDSGPMQPVLLEKLVILPRTKESWVWRVPDPRRYEALEKTLAPLFGKGGGSP